MKKMLLVYINEHIIQIKAKITVEGTEKKKARDE